MHTVDCEPFHPPAHSWYPISTPLMITEWVLGPSSALYPSYPASVSNVLRAKCSTPCGRRRLPHPFLNVAWRRDFSGPIWTSNGECQLQEGCQNDTKPQCSPQPTFRSQGTKEDGFQGVVHVGHLTHWDTNTELIYYLPGWMRSLWPAPTPSLPGSGKNYFSIFK